MNNPLRRIDVLRDARVDLRYLLDRDYKKESALRLVGDRYLLDRDERLVLFRSVYSKQDVNEIVRKRVRAQELRGARVSVDGFNVINTVEAALRGEPILLCDDGTLRDFSQIYGRYRLNPYTGKAIRLVTETLKELAVAEAQILYESQISRSGEIAALTRRVLSELGVKGRAQAVKSVDSQLTKTSAIVATSDSAILLRCRKHFDLAAHTIKTKIPQTRIQTLHKRET